MTTNYIFRHATVADTEIIADHRTLMFTEMGYDVQMLADAHSHYIAWLMQRFEDGRYVGILVECEDNVVAGAGMWFGDSAPLSQLRSGDVRRANIVNVYTNPEHRRKGLARQLMSKLIDIAREQEYAVILLHASDAGRSIYESMGFQDTNELILYI